MLNQIQVQEEVRSVFQSPSVISQFEAILRSGTNAYIQSALLCIADKPKLQECTPESLITAALRSATLGLSLDPSIRQAYMIPRPMKGVWTACFQPHYHGLYDLAVRTNKYRYISVAPIYDGETVLENMQTGIHFYVRENGKTLMAPNPGLDGLHVGYRDVTNGKAQVSVLGYLGYFKTIKGFEKSVWMTIQEIHKHAMTWAPENYKAQYSAWNDPKKRPTMEMKTVFIALSKFMDLSGEDNTKLKDAIEAEVIFEEDAPVNVTASEVEESVGADQTKVPEVLPIDSKVPSSLRPNETITDSDWNNFTRLVEQASNAGISLPDYNRTKMTASTINGASEYIRGRMTKK